MNDEEPVYSVEVDEENEEPGRERCMIFREERSSE